MNIQALPLVFLTGVAFGTSLVASRFGLSQFNPFVYTGLRLTLAGLGFVSIYLFSRRRSWPTDARMWRYTAVMGVFGTAIPMTAMLLSLRYLSSGIAAIFITTMPALTVLLAHFLLAGEQLTRRKMLGVGLALGGALLLAARGETGLVDGQSSWLGYGFIAIVLLFSSAPTIYARIYLTEFDAFQVTSVQIFTACLVMMPLSAIFIGVDLQGVNEQGYFALIYSAIAGNVIGFFCFFYIIKRFGATDAAMTGYTIPVVTGITGWLVLGEAITLGMVIGITIIILGLMLINSRSAT